MGSPLPPNPYKILGVPQAASLATIRSAHRKLVLTCHPDKFPDEAVKVQKSEQFHQVQQAYEILSDETKRQRYDECVKLAELRAEVMKEKGGSRMGSGQESRSRTAPEVNSRTRPTPVYEVRGDRLYEERAPNNRSHDENIFSTKFAEHRPSPRKYDDRYSPPAPRRASARMADEKRKARDTEDERYADKGYEKMFARQSAKAAEKSAKNGQEKRRDKDKRKDRETRFTTKSPYIGGDEHSDSDAVDRGYSKSTSSKRRQEDIRETRRRDRDEIPRRGSRWDDSDHDLDSKIHFVGDYIEQCRRTAPVEVETRRSAPVHKQNFSSADYEIRATPSSATPRSPIDDVRRSSARPRETRRTSPDRPSGRERHTTEIVEPPPTRRPSISRRSPELRTSKSMGSSKKEQVRPTEVRQLHRADTMPIGTFGARRLEPLPTKTKVKSPEINDSGYSSPGTPEMYHTMSPPLQRRTTQYKIDVDEDEPRRHKIYREPEEIDVRDRDRDRDRERDRERDRGISPKTRGPTTERVATAARPSASVRGPPQRSNSYAFQTETLSPRQASFPRAETVRAPPLQARQSSRVGYEKGLFGELTDPLDQPAYKVREAQQVRYEDIRWARRSPEDYHRDTYPGSHFEPRSTRSRNEKAY